MGTTRGSWLHADGHVTVEVCMKSLHVDVRETRGSDLGNVWHENMDTEELTDEINYGVFGWQVWNGQIKHT